MSEENKDAERAAFEAWRLEKFCAGVERLKKCSNAPDVYYYSAEQEAWKVWKARASLPVGVPEGSIYVECRQCDECQHGGINDAAAGLAACHYCDWTGPDPVEDKCPGCQSENSMAAACPKCGSRYVLVASEDIAAPAAPTVKAEQADEAKRIDKQCRDDVAAALGFVSGGNFAWPYLLTQIKECVRVAEAPSLPTAGSAVEEVEVVAWRYRHSEQEKWQAGVERKSLWETEPLMTVAQHERIVAVLRAQIAERDAAIEEWSGTAVQNGMEVDRLSAALSAQQSAHVSVPRELLERVATHLEWDGDESQTVIQYANKCDELAAELSALLNGGEA